MKVKSESEVAQLCLTLSDPMDFSLPGSSIHGIFQARVLEWGAIASQDISELSIIIFPMSNSLTKPTSSIFQNMFSDLTYYYYHHFYHLAKGFS